MKLKVNVKRKHIDTGVCENPRQCAVAKAILAIKGVTEVNVFGLSYADVRLVYKGKYYDQVTLNKTVEKFIDKFDDLAGLSHVTEEAQVKARKKLKPFSFTLNLEKVEEF